MLFENFAEICLENIEEINLKFFADNRVEILVEICFKLFVLHFSFHTLLQKQNATEYSENILIFCKFCQFCCYF